MVIDDDDVEELPALEVPQSATAAANRVTTFTNVMSIESPKTRTSQYANLEGRSL
jgi:hypothetical protein